MVETKLILDMRNGIVYLAALILSTGICLAAGPQKADSTAAPNWKAAKIDGHRTGVTAPSKDNVKTAIGTVEKGVYTAPNGRVFKKGATPAVARLMIDAQPAMAPVKEVLGYSEQEMKRYRPQC